jgi:hypothetical protein
MEVLYNWAGTILLATSCCLSQHPQRDEIGELCDLEDVWVPAGHKGIPLAQASQANVHKTEI